MRTRTIRIRTRERAEESVIVCGDNALGELASAPPAMIFTDSNVDSLYRETIGAYFPGTPVHVMPAGEENKTPETLFALLSAMAEAEMHRTDTLVCLGGGVVGDVGGLAAALYMRGISCIQVPTTLLAQVDSSVGGKTAVDFHGIKNLVGAFRQPRRVLVDGGFLRTLPLREIRCGLGEIVKHGALCPEIFDTLEENTDKLFDLDFLSGIVPANIAFKADVVRRDPEEKGLRKCLNLGHTTAHAYELSDGKLSHGEYVLVGTLMEAEISRAHGGDGAYLTRLQKLCMAALGEMPALPDAQEAARNACLDKKNTGRGSVVLTVPVQRGEYRLLELERGEYERELARIGRELC